jgi:hypothetical protein
LRHGKITFPGLQLKFPFPEKPVCHALKGLAQKSAIPDYTNQHKKSPERPFGAFDIYFKKKNLSSFIFLLLS